MLAYPIVNGVQVLLPPPSGYVVDLEHPARNGDVSAFWCFGVGNVLSLALLGQRLYTKVFLANGLQKEDFFIIISWVFSEITQCILIYEFAQGMEGVHGWELPIEKYKDFLLLSWVGPWVYLLCGSSAKLSLLTVYFRLSPFGWFRKMTQVCFALVAVHTVAVFILMIISCIPIQKSWDLTIPATEGYCINVVALYFATAIANIVTDAILMAIPIPLMVRLNMPTVQKIGVLIVFIFASGTIVTSVVRCLYLPSLLSSADETWAISQASICAIIEANLVIICASTTTLRRFLYHVAPSFMDYASGRGGARSSQKTVHVPLSSISRGKPMRRRSGPQDLHDEHELLSFNVHAETYTQSVSRQSDTDSAGLSDAAVETSSHKGPLKESSMSVLWRKDASPAVSRSLPRA